MCEARRRAVPERHAAARRRAQQSPRRLRRAALGHDRHAARAGAPQHAARSHGVLREMTTCSRGLTRGLDLSRARHGHRRARRATSLSFFPRGRRARRRAAEQLARRALAVGAGHRAEDAARAEAGQRRAVDAVPHRSRRSCKAGVPAEAFSYYPTDHAGGGRDPAPHRPQHVLRRRRPPSAAGKAIRASSSTGPGYSKVVIGAGSRRRLGAATST